MHAKRKRCIDVEVVENILSTTSLSNDFDDLIDGLDVISCNTPADETRLLEESINYVYDANTVFYFVRNAEKRYKRYLRNVNFFESGYEHIQDCIDDFLINVSVNTETSEQIKYIDGLILDAIEQVNDPDLKNIKKQKHN
jgi:hypothetical protein